MINEIKNYARKYALPFVVGVYLGSAGTTYMSNHMAESKRQEKLYPLIEQKQEIYEKMNKIWNTVKATNLGYKRDTVGFFEVMKELSEKEDSLDKLIDDVN